MTATEKTVDFLRHHFPQAKDAELYTTASDLELTHSCSFAMQFVDRRTRPLDQDLKDLKKVSEALSRAETLLKEIGLEGGALMVEVAHRLNEIPSDPFGDCRPTSSAAVGIISDWIADVRSGIQSAIEKQAHIQCAPARSAERRGAPAKIEATQFARCLYQVFQKLSGKTPSLSTDRSTNQKYGPFLEFVEHAFKHFDVEGSAVNMARAACREKKANN